MPKTIMVDHIKLVIDDENEFENLCRLLKENVQIDDLDGWEEESEEKQKFYDSKEFLKDANYYFNMSPPNLIQTSAKLWLACVYALKDSFLSIGVFPASHKCMNCLVEFVSSQPSVTSQPTAVRLMKGWEFAQKFHQFSYGVTNFNPKKFNSMMKDVEFFASNFPKVDSAILDDLIKVLSEESEVSYENRNGVTTLGKTTYKYSYKVF